MMCVNIPNGTKIILVYFNYVLLEDNNKPKTARFCARRFIIVRRKLEGDNATGRPGSFTIW